ncbi:phosphatase PAP2 family protein [Mycolicibacterium sphagni]|uniref:phosphatase PAP2 family protein n=1 Tax=Mycolicibacterium sphagni TaxID=1786 RepID=UPI0021F26F74|nr:phosphatase PAP2 family protein [Mycolicibacterium sphagni]MCV7177792.1 phosphatase PAP2 family protein [Mycolicibacterium sphagni]
MSSMKYRVSLSSLVAASAFAVIWIGFASDWAWLSAVDNSLLRVTHDFGIKHPTWISFWVTVSAVLGPPAFRVVAIPFIVVALVERRWRAAFFLALTIGVSDHLSDAVKNISDRPRPPSALVAGTSTSFPSGHALSATVGVLALLTVCWSLIPKRLHTPSIVIGTVVVVTVGAARVLLNVHNPSDVVAGCALGYLYYLFCLAVVTLSPPWRAPLDQLALTRRRSRGAAPDREGSQNAASAPPSAK